MKAEIKLLEAKIELLQAKLDRMKKESPIEVNAGYLHPHIEAFIREMCEEIQKRATEAQFEGAKEILLSSRKVKINYSGKWIGFQKDGRIVITDDTGKRLGKF